ncbi:MAG: UDP-N-acetylmuramoyl-tripeptide--D-alanyl-D-alanine ligase [Thermodesulfobacteriota bacterium]|nr:UDP-N-acetylmuramoyl-tripeptide--D-alanyl-D-alanine ligase [Thermodesulfobacteriota bacterium]
MTGLNMNLAEAALAVGARSRPGLAEITLSGVSTDTRTIRPGELFVALCGENFDGHGFVKKAFEQGAAAAVIAGEADPVRGRPCLRVPDTLRALGDLAAWLRQRQPLKVLAVTGSNGKTTTKEMLVKIISRKYKTLATKGNFNNLVGLPLTMFGLRPRHRAAVLEMGMNRPGEIARLTEIARPDVGLVTNIGPAHIEKLGDLRGVARAKGELYAGLKDKAVAVVNQDDPLVTEMAGAFGGEKLTFGFSRQAQVHVRGLRLRGLKGSTFEIVTPSGPAQISFSLLGRHNVANALAAAAGALALGLTTEDIQAGLEDFSPFPGRMNLKRLQGPVYLFDDTYNANPASTKAALRVLAALRGQGRILAVLGDMLELGPAAGPEHTAIGRTAAEMGVDILAAVGNEARALADEAGKTGMPKTKVLWFAEATEAADWLRNEIQPYDRVLVKGSRGMRMERIVKRLTGEEAA